MKMYGIHTVYCIVNAERENLVGVQMGCGGDGWELGMSWLGL
jgi:hypothetical protein